MRGLPNHDWSHGTATETGGTSGIVIDNQSTAGQASSIYFGRLGGPTAVKVTQSTLQ